MKWSQSIIAVSTAVSIVTAAPLIDRQDSAITDADILNYALTLEHLEDKFYREGLANFTQNQFADAGYDETFYANLKVVSSDETTHVDFLTTALKAANAVPVEECTYAFGVTDVKTFLATASILEGVGVSAYLGAAADIMSKSYLTAAGSILTVEARHSSYLRSSLKESPFAQPFDTPLTMDDVYTLAAGFIVSCPDSSPKLPVKAFPKLMLDPATSMPVKAGNVVTLLTPDYTLQAASGVATIYAAFISVSGPSFAVATPVDGGFTVTIPEDFNGQSYAVLTSCNETVSDETTAAGPVLIEIMN